jgi:hypothetical protein
MRIEDHERLDAEAGAEACAQNGYTDYKRFANGRDAAINRFLFTFAILADLTRWGYGDRWCFASYDKARAALAAWNGEEGTEPQGWHRHPDTCRRRPDGDATKEYIDP